MNEARVLVLTNIPSPYRVPLFNRLARQCELPMRVLFLAETESNRGWQAKQEQFEFEHRILSGWHAYLHKWEIPLHFNLGVVRELLSYRPDLVIIGGYDSLAYWQAALYCRLFGKSYILWSGTTQFSTRHLNGPIGWMKRRIVLGASGYIAYGSMATKYLESLGARAERVQVAVNTVDMEWFQDAVGLQRQEPTFQQTRRKYPPLLLLYSGQLIGRKGVQTLLEAMKQLDDQDIGLLIVGAGPGEQELQRFCKEQGLHNIYFQGFQQYTSLPESYALADVCVLPSDSEVWGLVVNEALASGLYVLCSNHAGAAPDLIREGWNGELFDPSDSAQLAQLIHGAKNRLAELHAQRDAIAEHALREFSIERSAAGILNAVRMVQQG